MREVTQINSGKQVLGNDTFKITCAARQALSQVHWYSGAGFTQL